MSPHILSLFLCLLMLVGCNFGDTTPGSVDENSSTDDIYGLSTNPSSTEMSDNGSIVYDDSGDTVVDDSDMNIGESGALGSDSETLADNAVATAANDQDTVDTHTNEEHSDNAIEPGLLITNDSWIDLLPRVTQWLNADYLEEIRTRTVSDLSVIYDPNQTIGMSNAEGSLLLNSKVPTTTNRFEVNYDCVSGGSIKGVVVRDIARVDDLTFSACEFNNQRLQGRLFYEDENTRGDLKQTSFDNFRTVSGKDVQLDIQANRRKESDRVSYREALEWQVIRLRELSTLGKVEIDNLDMLSEKRTGRTSASPMRFYVRQQDGTFVQAADVENNAMLVGSMTITTPWSEGHSVVINTQLNLNGDYVTGGGEFENSGLEVPRYISTGSGEFIEAPASLGLSPTVHMAPMPDNDTLTWSSGFIDVSVSDGSGFRVEFIQDDYVNFFVSVNGEGSILKA